jgi:hypothetical protein
LLAGPFTPNLIESIVRLGTWIPFVPVTECVTYICKVDLSEATARRKTEAAGQAFVEVQTAHVAWKQAETQGRRIPDAPVNLA